MASRSEEDLCCPVCQEVFRDPVVLSCSHSFCKVCVKNWWRQKPTQECPVCKRRSSKMDPPCNLVLKNLCESFLQEKHQSSSEALCSLHSEKLRLFCLDHQEPVCLVCRDSEKHSEHTFRPMDEAARQHKEKILETLKPLKQKLELQKKVQCEIDQTAEHMKVQARQKWRPRLTDTLPLLPASLLCPPTPCHHRISVVPAVDWTALIGGFVRGVFGLAPPPPGAGVRSQQPVVPCAPPSPSLHTRAHAQGENSIVTPATGP
ncbi:E3 ubiquitin-protein ligase TRIM39-like [Austrofundulus limnaeus]|uniref:E3 ubiquitin-protein ligase TRIM39-like n=1 Tax=Austrofundulus limnaeus TaxID=52670 RepID=A0A2I4C3S5_AUSLI|nr:PREDICTED: E3 ubiquitin-protein ligase TRIM39-like [Austrofundulus limnaeus]